MSDRSRPRPARDAGLTLSEILIVVAIVGLVVTVMSSSIVVTFRQHASTEGRVNVARAEQAIGMWMPADLASAATIDTSPDASPCGATVCDGIDLSTGSNVLMLSWTDVLAGGATVTTNVSYHFTEVGPGDFELWRVGCTGTRCTRNVVMTELPGPPAGGDFIPGVAHGAACHSAVDPVPCSRPDWVLMVSEPLAPDAVDDNDVVDASSPERKDANRVIVTINGGGRLDGAGGGVNQVSITAGGTIRGELPADGLAGAPTFSEARSRCGGSVVLIIDESSSIGHAIENVKDGVRTFVQALAGTPIQLQVIRFDAHSATLGTDEWHHYFDMSNQTDVDTLLHAINGLEPGGGTNWEEALFRTFYRSDTSLADVLPDTVVFFTDGVPTFDRLVRRTGDLPPLPVPPGPQWEPSNGTGYSQTAFNRASHITNQFRRSVRFVGVGVGNGIEASRTSEWIVDPGAGFVWRWERGYRRYQQAGEAYETNIDFEIGSDPESRTDFERRLSGSWRNTTPATYLAGNTTDDGSDGWRINGTRSWYNVTQEEFDALAPEYPTDFRYDDWVDITAAEYLDRNSTVDSLDGVRIAGTRDWHEVSFDLFTAYDTTPDETDGWRSAGERVRWVSHGEYEANNTTPDAADGWIDTGVEEWVVGSAALDWAPWPGDRVGDSAQYRQVKEYGTSGPPDGYDEAITATTQNQVILARLIAGNDYGTPAIWDGTQYTNAEVADVYIEPDWGQFPNAMRAIALGECGGTLTIKTVLTTGEPAPDTFRYQNNRVTDTEGNVLAIEPSVVTTDVAFPTGTFDFAIPSGQPIEVDVIPQNSSALSDYTSGSWSCTSGLDARAIQKIDVPDGWDGMRVQVSANEAVSCTFNVER